MTAPLVIAGVVEVFSKASEGASVSFGAAAGFSR